MSVQRGDLADLLDPSRANVKTFVLEAHSDEPERLLRELDEVESVQVTDDAYLFKLATGAGDVWVDTLDGRFWSFHTLAPMGGVQPLLRRQVGARRDLDWMWLPSGQLEAVWPRAERQAFRTDFRGGALAPEALASDLRVQLRGRDADKFLELVAMAPDYRSALAFDSIQIRVEEPGLGGVNELVSKSGRFLASGDSFDLHAAIVGDVVAKYRALVEEIEKRRFTWARSDQGDQLFSDTRSLTEDAGGTYTGSPIFIFFSRQIGDLDAWLSELLSARDPFRLWGRPVITSDSGGDTAEVDVVDLHVGQRFTMDVTQDYMRIYLPGDACGNTVTRLISNLQHRFDGSLGMSDPVVRRLARIGV